MTTTPAEIARLAVLYGDVTQHLLAWEEGKISATNCIHRILLVTDAFRKEVTKL